MAGEYSNPEECGLKPVASSLSTKLEELKEAMDKAKKEFDLADKEYHKKHSVLLHAKDVYEKELWKNKTCNSCMYSVVEDYSDYGDHNKCGCKVAPCTCCNHHCDYYEPDTIVTKALKEDKELNKDKWCPFALSINEVVALNGLGFDIYNPRYNSDGETVVSIMKLIKTRRKDDEEC